MRNALRRTSAFVLIQSIVFIASVHEVLAQTAPLTPQTVQAAIDWGVSGDPRPYLLHHAKTLRAGTNDVIVGAVFTPFLRIALAAHAAREEGRLLSPEEIPASLMAPVLHIAIRWYTDCEPEPLMSEPIVVAVPLGTSVRRPGINPRVERQPSAVFKGTSVLNLYGVRLPFPDVALVVSYPLEFFRDDVDFVISKHGVLDGRRQTCLVRGRIPSGELPTWR